MEPRLLFGTSLEELNLKAKEIHTRTHPSLKGPDPIFKDAPVDTRQFEATLTELEPDSRYYYAIYDGDTRLTPADKSYHFKTHPVPGTERPAYIWVVGDSGTGGKAQAQVHQAMVDYNTAHNLELDLYLHVGDMAYGSGTNKEFSDRFFDMYEPTLRNIVCWPSMGNHEGKTSKGATGIGPYYDAYIAPTKGEAGGLASGKEAYYSFDFGKVHFICLDSHDLDRRPTGEMAQWLKADLEKTKADFLIAFFHHPPYTKGSHDSDNEGQLIEIHAHRWRLPHPLHCQRRDPRRRGWQSKWRRSLQKKRRPKPQQWHHLHHYRPWWHHEPSQGNPPPHAQHHSRTRLLPHLHQR